MKMKWGVQEMENLWSDVNMKSASHFMSDYRAWGLSYNQVTQMENEYEGT